MNSAIRRSASKLQALAVGLFLFGALVRIVGFLQNASLNGDEAMLALSIGTRTFGQLLHPLDYGQVAPIPFLWAERLVTLAAGVSEHALRLLPLMAGIGLLWVVYSLADTLLGRVQALVALALSATSYPLMRYSVEVKSYIVDSLVSAVLIWIAVRTVENAEDRRWWASLATAGSVGVLVSTPAVLVCAGAVAGLAVAAMRRRRVYLLPAVALLGVLWGGIFTAAYFRWYAPNADASYMQEFWGENFLLPGTSGFLARFGSGLGELSCTLTCWRGVVDVWPMLLLLAAIGLAGLVRRRGLEYAIFLAGPIVAVFGASMLGRYPVATRLLLFSAPLFAILVAAGAVTVSIRLERSWPRIPARWILLLLLYPSLVLAVTLAVARPPDWGFHGTEVRPLADLFRQRSGGEPIYVFPRAVPQWVFHTTVWTAPDISRLAWVARIAGPGGPGFINGASRGTRTFGEGSDLVYSYAGVNELYGTSTGAQVRRGHLSSREPDLGWAESEAWRIRRAARPYIWIIIADYTHGPLDEGEILMNAVAAAGGVVVFDRATADAVLFRVRFPPALGD